MDRRHLLAAVVGMALAAPGAIAGSAQPSFEATAAATRAVAEPYFAAYIARDWATLEPLLAASGTFTDPTAEPVFGQVMNVGKAAVMKNFREGYAAIKSMRFNRTRAFVSGPVAVFEGTLDWTLALASGHDVVTQGMPFVTTLRVVDGQVVEHRDYADYHPFVEAHRKAKAGG